MTAPRLPDELPDASGTPDALDAVLRGLRSAVAFPPTPDLATAVARALQGHTPSRRRARPVRRGRPPVRRAPAPVDRDAPPGIPGASPAATDSSSVAAGATPVVTGAPPVILSVAKDLPGACRPEPFGGPAGRSWAGRFAVAGLALALLVGAALALSGELRSAVAERLGIPGIRLEVVDETPTAAATRGETVASPSPPVATASPVGVTLLLGEPMRLTEAQAAIPYAIRAPAVLGEPDEVYIRPVSEGSMVALLYRARPGLPAAAETGVGALLMQFPAGPDSADIAKKVLLGQGSLVEVTVDGELGYWVTGASDLVIIADPASSIEHDPGRPSANVLLWASGGITYRLETALPLDDALALAESLVVVDAGTPSP